MTQCDRVYAVLADGLPHSMRSIHERAGFMRLNSRISELRDKRELFIYCWHEDGDWRYQLISLGESTEGDHGVVAVDSPSVSGVESRNSLPERRSAPQQLLIWDATA